MIVEALEALCLLFTSVFAAYLVRHFVFTFSVIRNANRTKKRKVGLPMYEPTVAVLIPAHNEARVIGRILQRMTELSYPKNKLEVIVIDDASTDATLATAQFYEGRYSNIKVLHRNQAEGGRGKAQALNHALKVVEGEIVICFDADYYPRKDILERLVGEFTDPSVGAVQGRVTVLNEPFNLVTRLVALERVGGYRVDQEARESLGLIPQFGGTVGGFRRQLLISMKGWDESILAEDTDLTFRLFLTGNRVGYVNDAECYEEAVESWHAYWTQRYRWAKGHMKCAFKHSWGVLTSSKLTLRQKIDGLLLLNIYFMPVLALLSWLTLIPLVALNAANESFALWALMPLPLYIFTANFAPFFEVGVGMYLDRRTRASWLIPLLIFTFLLNIPICTKALLDLIRAKIMRKDDNHWDKTFHSGNGNSYMEN